MVSLFIDSTKEVIFLLLFLNQRWSKTCHQILTKFSGEAQDKTIFTQISVCISTEWSDLVEF